MKKVTMLLIVFLGLSGTSFSDMWFGISAPFSGNKYIYSTDVGRLEQRIGVRFAAEYTFYLPYLEFTCPSCGNAVRAPLGNAPALGIEINVGQDWGITGKEETEGDVSAEWKTSGTIVSTVLKYHFPTDTGKKMHFSVGSGPEIALLKKQEKDSLTKEYGEAKELTNLRFIAPIVLDYDIGDASAKNPVRISFIVTLGGTLISGVSTWEIDMNYGLGIGLKRRF